MMKYWQFSFNSYSARSYTDVVEQTGALAIQVPYDLAKSKLDYLLKNLNGIVIPGGEVDKFNPQNGKPTLYMTRMNYIIESAKTFNDEGKHFPILGICNGMQVLTIHASDNKNDLEKCYYNDWEVKHPVKPTKQMKDSEFWQKFD
jgi:gamma-glutamyl-gamma-aminobutyrate hydrolase PuuD